MHILLLGNANYVHLCTSNAVPCCTVTPVILQCLVTWLENEDTVEHSFDIHFHTIKMYKNPISIFKFWEKSIL